MINYSYEDRYLALKLIAWLKVNPDEICTKQSNLISVIKKRILSKESDERRKNKKIDQPAISNILKASYGRIGRIDNRYQYVGKPIYNGLNGMGLISLIDLQRNYGALKNPYIMCLQQNVLLLEVSEKFKERVADSIKRFLTRRYLYDLDYFGNHLVLILIPDGDRTDCNTQKRGKSSRSFLYKSIALDRANASNPVLDKDDYDDGIMKNNDEELSCNEIKKMLEAIIAVKKKSKSKKQLKITDHIDMEIIPEDGDDTEDDSVNIDTWE